MQRFKRILYLQSTDDTRFEEQVLDKLISLAKANIAEVTVVNVFEDSFIEHVGRALYPHSNELLGFIREKKQQRLDHAVSVLSDAGVQVRGELFQGTMFVEVIREVLRNQQQLVVKVRDPFDNHDAVAMHLFRKCPCPVWIINGEQFDGFRVCLGALDLGSTREETIDLNRKIVELTCSMAERMKGNAYFVHAWELEHEVMLRGPRFNYGEDKLADMKKSLQKTLVKNFDALTAGLEFHVPSERVHLVEGDVKPVVHHILQQVGADLLIMGSVARTGLPGLLIGNSAETILSEVRCSILAVKPDGFISPISLTT
ncbi:universal stress protein [Desulfogranum japonicum]|uniref:universal stress protein n=1 Tax=Desulfogranum japonicum TaxID=231447 RepID=UPI00040ABB6C|nr:universal stress protein [Desulfogranum japonicum]